LIDLALLALEIELLGLTNEWLEAYVRRHGSPPSRPRTTENAIYA
jgi:hypothetical protein